MYVDSLNVCIVCMTVCVECCVWFVWCVHVCCVLLDVCIYVWSVYVWNVHVCVSQDTLLLITVETVVDVGG